MSSSASWMQLALAGLPSAAQITVGWTSGF
jgi:hypothetical protein